ncbi:hypothetical protein [uncultured Eubacterium sp.]|uniref:hypothetical protein n=1 Tax=uncultured Eubacterium sp. TaxID=165185 RepID=UPI002596BE33|nr:hypothetical protein [uncultured Eubacterium sp.]
MKEKYNKMSFVTNLLIIMCAIIGTIIMYSNVDGGDLASGGIKNFKYYTVLSNEFCGLVALIKLESGQIQTIGMDLLNGV